MLDCHIHLERGPYTIDWLKKFVFVNTTAIKGNILNKYTFDFTGLK